MTPNNNRDPSTRFALDRRDWLVGLATTALVPLIGTNTAIAATGPRTRNVIEYGATGDGETDDSDAIQAAIDDAADGDTVYFPEPDEYYLVDRTDSTVILRVDSELHANNLTLEGENEDTVIKLADGVEEAHGFIYVYHPTDYSVTIKNLVFDGNRENIEYNQNVSHAINFRARGAMGTGDMHVENVEVKDMAATGIDIQYGGVTMEDVTCHGCGHHGIGTSTDYSGEHDPMPVIKRAHLYDNSHTHGFYGVDLSGGKGAIEDSVIEENNTGGAKTATWVLEAAFRRVRIQDHGGIPYQRTGHGSIRPEVIFEDIVIENNAEWVRFSEDTNYTIEGEFVVTNNAYRDRFDVAFLSDCSLDAEDAHIYINDSQADDNFLRWSSGETGTIGHLSTTNNSGSISNNGNLTIEEQDNERKTDIEAVPTADEVGAFAREPDGAPDFELSIDGTNSPVGVVGTVDVDVTVENAGDATGHQTITLTRGDEELTTQQLALVASESREVTLSWKTTEADVGNQMLTVGSEDHTQTVEVEVEDRAVFTIDSLDVTETAAAGDVVEVTASVTNTGGEAGEDDIELSVAGETVDTVARSLAPDESDEITLSWATGPGDVGARTVTVSSSLSAADATLTILEAAAFEVEIIEATTPIEAGGELAVQTVITNIGEATADKEITLEALDEIVDTQPLELAGGADSELTLTWSPDEAAIGEWTLSVHSPDATATVDVQVVERVLVEVAVWSMNTPIDPGDTLEVEAGLTNLGDVQATRDIRLEIDGDEVDHVTTTIDGGSVDSVDLAWATTEDDVGEFEVTIRSDQHSQSELIQVGDPGDDTADDPADDTSDDTTPPADDTDDDDADGLPGFGVGGAIAGVSGIAYMLKRRLGDDEEQ